MNSIILAQSVLVVSELRSAAFWAELDAAICRLHGTVVVHSHGTRHYRLAAIEMHVVVAGSLLTVSWIGVSPVLDARARIDLRQSADAWLDALAALMLHPAPVTARVQAASALLAAGFESVTVSPNGVHAVQSHDSAHQALAA